MSAGDRRVQGAKGHLVTFVGDGQEGLLVARTRRSQMLFRLSGTGGEIPLERSAKLGRADLRQMAGFAAVGNGTAFVRRTGENVQKLQSGLETRPVRIRVRGLRDPGIRGRQMGATTGVAMCENAVEQRHTHSRERPGEPGNVDPHLSPDKRGRRDGETSSRTQRQQSSNPPQAEGRFVATPAPGNLQTAERLL